LPKTHTGKVQRFVLRQKEIAATALGRTPATDS
jgi:acyl-coenzyme A synthetase/AMP-(fatty) acid ligase